MAAHHPKVRLAGPLARARGLGAAGRGLGHWWAQRVSAMALAPLTLWFVWSAAHFAGADQATVKDWLSRPASAILMSLFVVALFYHLTLGVQVVLEDYVHRESVRFVALLLIKGLIVLAAAAALFTVLHVAFAG